MDKSEAIAQALRRYCAAHPRAADTLQGVRGWLPAELRMVALAELAGVLQSLLTEGVVTLRPLPDGTIIYFSAAGATSP